MAKEKNTGIARLDRVIAEQTNAGLLGLVVNRMAEGDSPQVIAASMKVPYIALKRWLEADDARSADVSLAYRCMAETLAHDSLLAVKNIGGTEIVEGVSIHVVTKEDIAVAKLRAEHFLKLAAQWDKKAYGNEKGDAGGNVNITVDREGVLVKSGGQSIEIKTAEIQAGASIDEMKVIEGDRAPDDAEINSGENNG